MLRKSDINLVHIVKKSNFIIFQFNEYQYLIPPIFNQIVV